MPADLSPARWIWLPSGRTLPNTFALFRRTVTLEQAPVKSSGHITADSRYLLTVNGKRVQRGPAPSDPRWPDVDPFDITDLLREGENVVAVHVLFYGHGEGTWAAGKPGLLLKLDLEFPDGGKEQVVSDDSWLTALDRGHPPGQHRRWALRALQEQFDARLFPFGWDQPDFEPGPEWIPAMVLPGPADKPSICNGYHDLLAGIIPDEPEPMHLIQREIPPLREFTVAPKRLAEQGRVEWKRPPEDWFDLRIPGSFEARAEDVADEAETGAWTLRKPSSESESLFLTFEFEEQLVGRPCFSIDAPEGAIVEVITQESHEPGSTPWLDTHFCTWSRFICRSGMNHFEAFDYDSFRWLQLHIRNQSGPVTVSNVAAVRRRYDWPGEPEIKCPEGPLQRLFDACINTLNNSAQETVVDGMGRERQQYSGDVGHQLHAVRYAFGETRQARRYLRTFSEGLTKEGYFFDTWPAYDRLQRIGQRQFGGTRWGPLIDHGVGFVFDCWNHYMETGDLEALETPYPRLLTFAQYLECLRNEHGLLPVENLGTPAVWIDHDAYQKQRHKQCAFNLYAAAMFEHALAPICRAFGDGHPARLFRRLGSEILSSTVLHFWDHDHGLFIANRPWREEEGAVRLCDRSLANAVLFDQCPLERTGPAVKALAECPPEMGFSYPANAGWRLRALAKSGRIDVVLDELRSRWAALPSVMLNNTLQEDWGARPDSTDEWSHCPVAPLYVLYMDIAGITPIEPGFSKVRVRPQLGDIGGIELTAHTPKGPVTFAAQKTASGHHLRLELPPQSPGLLCLPDGAESDIPPGTPSEFDIPS